MKPLVSILIPAYNSETWLAESIKSALAQTWDRKEIIIVDDGSTDATFSVASEFESSIVRVEQQENQGAAAARNTAYSLCQGDYADDMLAPSKVARQMEFVLEGESPRTLLSGPWGKFYYRLEKASFRPSPLWRDLSPLEWLLSKMGENCHMQTATWLVSRELTEAAGPWDTRLLSDDDGEYFCRVILESERIKFEPEAQVFYRVTDCGRLSYVGDSDAKMEALFLSMQLQIQNIRSIEDSSQVRDACLRYLQKYMSDFCPERPDIVGEMQTLAAELGGGLTPPRVSWKYAAIEKLGGWGAAKKTKMRMQRIKHSTIQRYDREISRLQGHGRSSGL